MSGRRGLSDDERAMWENVTRRIKPLKPGRTVATIEVPGSSARPARKAAEKAGSAAGPSPPKAPPPLAPLSRREKQRAARGHDPIDARLDLHGHTQSEAHTQLLRFLRRASAGEARLALVITGKSGVLRRQVPLWLTTPEFRALVISVDTAAIGHGGEGALYIRVRRGR